MSEDQKKAPPNAFLDTVKACVRGRLVPELDEAMREVVQAVKERGKAGSLSLTIKVKPAAKGDDLGMLIIPDIKVTKPKAERGETFMFATEDAGLSTQHPNQLTLFDADDLRDGPDEAQRMAPLREVGAAEEVSDDRE